MNSVPDDQDARTEASTDVATTPPTARRVAAKAQTIGTIAEQSGWSTEAVDAGHVLIFPRYVRQISTMHQVKLEMFTVDVDRDLYHFKGSDFGLKKDPLERMGDLAGIRFKSVVHTYPEPGVVVCTVVGGGRGPEGVIAWKMSSKEWIEDVELAAIEKRADERQSFDTEELRARWIRSELAEAKRERLTKTETKAKSRVRREVLGLPAVAPKDFWSKPFFIPRIDVLIDANDPHTRERVMDDAWGARKFLFPTPDTADAVDVEVLSEEASAS